jgi:hypothetical protein
MAYVDTQHEIIILYPYKTGTHTIRKLIEDSGRASGTTPPERKSNHPTLEQVKEWRPEITNIYDWDVYSFYREPCERMLSWMAYKHDRYPELEPTSTVMEFMEKHGSCRPQTAWLKHPVVNVKLLDFRNFNAELRRVLGRVGINPQTIPVLNTSSNTRKPVDMSAEEVDVVKDFFKEDYEFFYSRGITFPI